MIRNKKMVSIVLLMIVCGLCVFVSKSTWAQCVKHFPRVDSNPCPPERNIKVKDLLIDESAFPSGWQANALGPAGTGPAPMIGLRRAREETSLGFSPITDTSKIGTTTGAGQFIDRYYTFGQAISNYQLEKEAAIRPTLVFPSWEVPENIHYDSKIADEFYFACTKKERISKCTAVARYGEYVTKFNVTMTPEVMSYKDLEKVFKAIDERMVKYLVD